MPKSRSSTVFISENFTPFYLQFSSHPLNAYTSMSRASLLLQSSSRALTTQPPSQYHLTTTTYSNASFLDQNNVLVMVEKKPRKPESIWFRRRYLLQFGSDKFPFRKTYEVTELLCPSFPWFSHCNRRHTIKIANETHSYLVIVVNPFHLMAIWRPSESVSCGKYHPGILGIKIVENT